MTTWFRTMMLVAVLALTGLSAFTVEDSGKNILVIGWDGVQRDHLKKMIERDEVPVLKKLSEEGTLIDIDVTTAVTDTKAGWAQIFTGYAPEITGVYSNSRFQPVPADLWVFDRAEKHFGADKIDTVAIIGKKDHIGNDAGEKVPFEEWQKRQEKVRKTDKKKPGMLGMESGKIVEEDGKKFVEVPGKPWYFVSSQMDLFVNGLNGNEAVGERALAELEKRKDNRFLFFAHFAKPDHAGHKSGENSQDYTDAIKDTDMWTGRLLEKLKELGLYEKTIVYIVSDHGFDEDTKGHRYAPYVCLVTNDKEVNRNGDRMDIAPTLLKRLGMDPGSFEPKIDGIALDEPAPERKAPSTPPPGYAEMRGASKPGKGKELAAPKERSPRKRKADVSK